MAPLKVYTLLLSCHTVAGGGIVDFVEREYDLDGRKITLQVWDTAGQEQYDSITTSYFRSAEVSWQTCMCV